MATSYMKKAAGKLFRRARGRGKRSDNDTTPKPEIFYLCDCCHLEISVSHRASCSSPLVCLTRCRRAVSATIVASVSTATISASSATKTKTRHTPISKNWGKTTYSPQKHSQFISYTADQYSTVFINSVFIM